MKSAAGIQQTNNILTMESLALPQELYWNGKEEPTSPPSSELFSINDTLDNDWLTEDNLVNGLKFGDDVFELKDGIVEYISHELIDGEDLVVELIDLKEEHWNDPKLLSSNGAEYPLGIIISSHTAITKVANSLEFNSDSLYESNNLDTAVLTQLTPPHSPPRSSNNASPTAYQTLDTEPAGNKIFQSTSSLSFATSLQPTASTVVAPNNLNNIDLATQIVDDIVNTRAREIFTWNDETQSSCSTPSLAEDSSASCTDEEWMPSSFSDSSSLGGGEIIKPTPMELSGENTNNSTTNSTTSKKRTRPYGRGIEDRKIRKKEQNKNAATRYRQKKKLEMEEVLGEEKVLLQRNEDLKRTLAEREREAKYLKTLIYEFYQHKK